MDNLEQDKKVVLDAANFQILERQAMDSIDRMTNNSFINFMLISMFRNSTDAQKKDMIELVRVLRADITEVHKAKAGISFKMTGDQLKRYMDLVDDVVNNSFKHIEKEIALYETTVEKGL